MKLRGYRSTDVDLLTGHWLTGELLGVPLPDRPALSRPSTVAAPADDRTEVCVAPGVGFVHYADLDWVHRGARLEIGFLPAREDTARELVAAALAHAWRVLNLHRVHGWVTPATTPPTEVLDTAGFRWEATVPEAGWLAGRAVDREIWGVVRDV